MSDRQQTVRREFAAGGVVIDGDRVAVIVPKCQRRILALPKGGIDEGERETETALREIKEETGLNGELLGRLGDVCYSYLRNGSKVNKRVAFFLCNYLSGSTEDHDHEVEEARWIPASEAIHNLTYEGEREMVARALRQIRFGHGGPNRSPSSIAK